MAPSSAFVLYCKQLTTVPGKSALSTTRVLCAKQECVRADEMGEMYSNKTYWLESHHDTTRHSMVHVRSDLCRWPLDTLVTGTPWPDCLNSCHSICH